MFTAKLVVTSGRLRLSEITEALGGEPDESYDIGSSSTSRPDHVRNHAEWLLDLRIERTRVPGAFGLPNALEGLSDELAARLGALSSDGCHVVLRVLQEMSADDSSTHGLFLSRAAVRWLARAGAEVDVDQYVLESGDAEDDESEPSVTDEDDSA